MPDKIDIAELEKDKRTWKTECECNLLERLVGDGCHFCNPSYVPTPPTGEKK